MIKYLTAFGAGVVIVALVLERRSGEARAGAFAMPVALGLFQVGGLAFSNEVSRLVPPLHNNRPLAIHVASMLAS